MSRSAKRVSLPRGLPQAGGRAQAERVSPWTFQVLTCQQDGPPR
jgi:hypothetical protein